MKKMEIILLITKLNTVFSFDGSPNIIKHPQIYHISVVIFLYLLYIYIISAISTNHYFLFYLQYICYLLYICYIFYLSGTLLSMQSLHLPFHFNFRYSFYHSFSGILTIPAIFPSLSPISTTSYALKC